MIPPHDDLTAVLLDHARRAPGAAAIVAAGRAAMTFGELLQRTEAMMGILASQGIGRGDVVAWPAIRRLETAAALAIMPASAALAPLGAALTVEQYTGVFRRLGVKALALPTGVDHASRVAARNLGIAELDVAVEDAGPAGAFELRPGRAGRSHEQGPSIAADVAYIIVTSGTTGEPKLVPCSHRAIMAVTRPLGQRLCITADDVSAQLTPVHLGNGLRTGLLLSLLHGGATRMLPEGDVAAFLATVHEDEITYGSASYTFFREVLRHGEARRPPRSRRLRFLRVASGRLEPGEFDRLTAMFGVPVLAGLAASETGTITHQHLVLREHSTGSAGPPLDIELRLVDTQGAPVPSGETGALEVRGPSVFAGYLDDPALNALSFADGWFRMGDLCRLDDAGELHVLGRVKEVINRGGEKISPQEVDLALRAVPGVLDAAAFAVPHPALGEEIVAAVVRKPDCTIAADDVIAAVRAALGARRAPRQIWFVASLPRSASDKVMRRALPDWVGYRPLATKAPAMPAASAPRSPLEVALAALWCRILGHRQIEAQDNFFMLGGDSLRGVGLLADVRAAFGVSLPVEALFADAGTLAGMADAIEVQRAGAKIASSGPTVPRRQPDTPAPLSSQQERMWFLHRLAPASAAYHERRSWQIDGDLDIDALRGALEFVATRHPMLRTRFVAGAGEPRQVVAAQARTPLEIVEIAPAADSPALLQAAIRERVLRPFDPAAAPPVRWTLFRLGARRHVLLRVWHHILADAQSARILQRDLGVAYAALRAGAVPDLPSLPVDYGDWSVWQAQRWVPRGPADIVAYWRRKLADLPPLALPTDLPRPSLQSFRGARVEMSIPASVVAPVEALGRAHDASPFVTLLAAFSALLGRLANSADVAIGTPVSGRPHPELADVVGFFANTLVMRCDLSGEPDAVELIARTRECVASALTHADMPFETLVQAIGAPRDPSRNPLFQVSFALHDAADAGLALDGVRVTSVESEIEFAKFDLALALRRDGEGITAAWDYCTELFHRASIEGMSRQFVELLAAMAAHPERPLTRLRGDTRTDVAPPLASGACPQPLPIQDTRLPIRRSTLPRALIEQRLVRIWSDLFVHAKLDASAHFLDLGADSVTAATLATTIARETGVDIPPAVLFAHGTLSGLIRLCAEGDLAEQTHR